MATVRPRPQAIRLTEAAVERIKFVMANAAKPIVGVRVGVRNGGCAGMTYTMEYAEHIESADEVVEDQGRSRPDRSQGRAVPDRDRDGLQGR